MWPKVLLGSGYIVVPFEVPPFPVKKNCGVLVTPKASSRNSMLLALGDERIDLERVVSRSKKIGARSGSCAQPYQRHRGAVGAEA